MHSIPCSLAKGSAARKVGCAAYKQDTRENLEEGSAAFTASYCDPPQYPVALAPTHPVAAELPALCGGGSGSGAGGDQ